MNQDKSSGDVVRTLEERTGMEQSYLMNLLIDIEARIKTKNIYGGNFNLSESNFGLAGDYIFDTYKKMNPAKQPLFVFNKDAIKDVYWRVDQVKPSG